MNLPRNISYGRHQAGILLIECLVYIAVFAIFLGGGTAAFYFYWDHSKALMYTTNDITAALHAGERWRADVRAATGNISIAPTATGEMVRIPELEKEVVYRFEAGELRREIPALHHSQLLLPKVKSSQMAAETRGSVSAWRWELELSERRKETHLPLLFTFEAAQKKTMRIQGEHFKRRTERGMATVIFIALLAIMLILVTAESRALIQLRREVKLLQQQQIKRLNFSQTNPVTATQPDSK